MQRYRVTSQSIINEEFDHMFYIFNQYAQESLQQDIKHHAVACFENAKTVMGRILSLNLEYGDCRHMTSLNTLNAICLNHIKSL